MIKQRDRGSARGWNSYEGGLPEDGGGREMKGGGGGSLLRPLPPPLLLLLLLLLSVWCGGIGGSEPLGFEGTKLAEQDQKPADGADELGGPLPPNTKYTVVTHINPRPKHHTPFVIMTSHDGGRYECVLPSLHPHPEPVGEEEGGGAGGGEKPGGGDGGMGTEEEKQREAEKNKEEEQKALNLLLEPLSGRCFVKGEGYWSFEVCHRKKIRQFHESERKRAPGAPVSVEYSLGDFDVKVPAVPTEGAMVAHAYEGGTRCDETSGPRHSVVNYVCEPGADNQIRSIVEVSTCSYSIIFSTPLLCSHPSVRSAVGLGGTGAGLKKGGVADYLSGLEGSCFYRVEGWWTYEFCYRKAVKQFHQENGVNTAEFVLGVNNVKAKQTSDKDTIQMDEGSKEKIPYFSQMYTQGTSCDVTGQARQTEVRFKCAVDSHNVVASIKERSTCSYILEFFTPLVCPHPQFQATNDPMRSIDCYPEAGIPVL